MSLYTLVAIAPPMTDKTVAFATIKRVLAQLLDNGAKPFGVQYQDVHPLPRRMRYRKEYIDKGSSFVISFFSAATTTTNNNSNSNNPESNLSAIRNILRNNTELLRSSILRKM